MCFQIRKLLRDFGREVWLESMFQHDLFCGCLQVKVSGTTVVHGSPKGDKSTLKAYHGRIFSTFMAPGPAINNPALW